MIGARKFALSSWFNWLLRLCFTAVIFKCLENDFEAIKSDRAVFECGLTVKGLKTGTKKMYSYFKSIYRELITHMSLIVITWYLFTSDAEGQETVLDQVKDFTALVIIVEIDNMLVGFSDICLDQLDIKYKERTLEEKFTRYANFQYELSEASELTYSLYMTFNKFITVIEHLRSFIMLTILFIVSVSQGLG